MTLLCAPVKKIITSEKVDLFEITYSDYKLLYNQKGEACFYDIDWKKPFPNTILPVIISYHNYDHTPNLEQILHELKKQHPKAHFYKIVTMASSILDSLRMLIFLKNNPSVIGICMGELGKITRICSPIFHVPITYTPLNDQDINASGQLLIDELLTTYNFRYLNESTQLFGLIGYPISKSIGHLFHNDYFQKKHQNSLYVKMEVKEKELPLFFAYIKELPFKGLSITAPLKEVVTSYLDQMDKESEQIGSVNTVVLSEGKIKGYNTDGKAAIKSLGDIKNKKITIIGTGGAARAVIYKTIQKGACVTIVSRLSDRAKALAEHFKCQWSLSVETYDILVNASGFNFNCSFNPNTLVMDLSYPRTRFLQSAQLEKCRIIDGFSMYFLQARAQQKIWYRF